MAIRIRAPVLIFILVALTALIGALAMAAALSFNLNRGFNAYLQARDAEQLDEVVSSAQAEALRLGGLSEFEKGSFGLRDILSE